MTSLMTLLGEVADVFNGKTPAASEQRGSGHPVLKIKDIRDDGIFCGAFDSFVDEDFVRRFESKKIREGDTLILNAAHNAEYVGSKRYYTNTDVAGAIATGEWLIIRANAEKAHSSYVWHWLQAPSTRFKLKKLVKGIHLYPRDVRRLEIPLPSLTKQKRIAAILDKADAIRCKRQKIIQLVDKFLNSVFLDMFGDPVHNKKGWPVKMMVEWADKAPNSIKAGPFGSSLKKEEYTNDGYRIYGQEQVIRDDLSYGDYYISEGKYKSLSAYAVKAGDILISLVGTFGQISVVPETFEAGIINPRLMKISPDRSRVHPIFFRYLLKSAGTKAMLSQRAHGGTMDIINVGIMRELALPQPPLAEQMKFVDLETHAQKLGKRALESETHSQELFGVLTQCAFRGEL